MCAVEPASFNSDFLRGFAFWEAAFSSSRFLGLADIAFGLRNKELAHIPVEAFEVIAVAKQEIVITGSGSNIETLIGKRIVQEFWILTAKAFCRQLDFSLCSNLLPVRRLPQ